MNNEQELRTLIAKMNAAEQEIGKAIIVHPEYQGQGIGVKLVKELLQETERFGLGIVTVTYEENNSNFYKSCGFTPGSGGVWQSNK